MRIATVLAATLLLCPLGASAQGTEFKGLDLSDEPKKEEKKEETPAVEERPTLPPPVETASPTPAPKGLSEVEIANEDRVKSVQRKPVLKRMRLEFTPQGFVTLNDAYYPKMGPGGRLAFFFADSVGLAFRYNQFNVIPSDNVRLAKRQLQSKLPYVHPKHSFSADLLWSPIYGKVALFNSIHTFDIYLVGGAGAFLTQTSDDVMGTDAAGKPVQLSKGDGAKFSAHLGIGQRFSLNDWFALDVSLTETMYSDRPDGGTKSVLQHIVALNFGLSVFLPFGFEYKEP